jgi:CRISPR-associated protein Cas2
VQRKKIKSKDMIRWVMYDIRNDKARTLVARHCKQAGLYRVQLSVFLGTLSNTEFDELQLEIEDLINEDHDKVYLFSMGKNTLRQSVQLGQAVDRKLVTDTVQSLFI